MDLKEEIAQAVAQETGIETTKRDIEEVLSSLLVTSHFWEIVQLARQPFNVVVCTIKILGQKGWIEVGKDGAINLTPSGQKAIEGKGIKPKKVYRCRACMGRGVGLEGLEEVLKRFKEIAAHRPEAIIEYDQGYVTPETTVSRIALLADRGDLEGKKLLVLGDDDLVSLAAGLSGLPQEVVVLEIDERLLNFINEVAQRENMPVKAERYDFRQPLPSQYVGYFDTFITDPPETLEALEVCLSRGLASLKGEGCAGYFGLTHAESSLKKWNRLQQLLVGKFKVTITDIIEDFNQYVNWDYLLPSLKAKLPFVEVEPQMNWYHSAMYRIQVLERVEAVKNEPAACELYVDEEALIYGSQGS
ncbi:hypothetical protein SAMN00808754_0943 [Thermanaeromonas toyohensis ToBE]|uniref:N(4)-bis(aminopropyl)spermidine synthase n=1 Tax=Thermanaeromonas toyohensis ToBE TaxID=698762 RepID=A0A1W1VLM4_9FIRM|nr:bis-aminopropyl spermidine synthase family protein [Thermanaeromonas toyohensis]SMB93951.1 hypothetical protein SAMN00808754_0943 [Thermanaeromonas toyohensis ToBE]